MEAVRKEEEKEGLIALRFQDYIALVERATRVTSQNGQQIIVMHNPTRDEYEGLMRRVSSQHGPPPQVRGLLGPFDVYLWDAALMTHWFMCDALGIDYDNYFCFYIERRGDRDVATSEDHRSPASLGLEKDFWRVGLLTRIMKKPAQHR